MKTVVDIKKSVLKSTIFLNVFRKYLPVLKGFPAKYIHAPWTAPESVQKAARCIIGQDYPAPIVDHNKVSRANLEKLRNIFKALLCYKDSGKTLLWFIHKGVARGGSGVPVTPPL